MMDGEEGGDNHGIVPHVFEHICEYIRVNQESHTHVVQIQYIELYNEQIRDLLAAQPTEESLRIREDSVQGFYVIGVTVKEVKSILELFKYQNEDRKGRKTRATKMRDDSSQSHSVLTLNIESLTTIEGSQHFRKARLNLVDLAGSKRAAKTEQEGQSSTECVSINCALLVLGKCISALTSKGHSHIPYLDSALTKLLRDLLGGKTRMLMIATVGPADYNFSESIDTLRYGENAKKIKNKPKVNMDPKDALLLQLKEENDAIEAQLQGSTPDGQAAERERKIKEMEVAMEREKRRPAEESQMAAEERAALQRKLEEHCQQIDTERAAKSQFSDRLKDLMRFLGKGTGALKAVTQRNDAELAVIQERLRRREERAAHSAGARREEGKEATDDGPVHDDAGEGRARLGQGQRGRQ
jgi:kinesin family protein 3/17